MAFLGTVQRECDHKNRINRNVSEHSLGALNINSFWNTAVGTNFLITGGYEPSRTQILSTAIPYIKSLNKGPIIILNGNQNFENTIIHMANQKMLGRIYISSLRYNRYDMFSGMSIPQIKDIIQLFAQNIGMSDIGGVIDYSNAFLRILNTKYRPNLLAMSDFAKLTNENIAAFGQAQGAAVSDIEVIQNGVSAGRYFRQILIDINSCVSNIQCKNETGFSLLNMQNANNVFLIWSSSPFQYQFNAIMASELRKMLSSGRPFTLILNDILLTQGDKLTDVINDIKNSGFCNVGICTENAAAWSSCTENQLLNNFPAMVVLSTGHEDTADQDIVLARFGKYMHYEAAMGVAKAPGIIHLPGDGGKAIHPVNFEKNRVSIEDMRRFTIAAKGHRGSTIELFTNITFS